MIAAVDEIVIFNVEISTAKSKTICNKLHTSTACLIILYCPIGKLFHCFQGTLNPLEEILHIIAAPGIITAQEADFFSGNNFFYK